MALGSGSCAGLLKEKGQIIKKRNAIQGQLKVIEAEIVKFQSLKQASLNNVEVAITLKMNQVILLSSIVTHFHRSFFQREDVGYMFSFE